MNNHRNSNCLQWAVIPGDRFRICRQTVQQLMPGAYCCSVDDVGSAVLEPRHPKVDALIDFPDSLAGQIIDEIERFWTLGDRFHKYGFLHRRGYLLYGKQGCGKSSLIHLIISRAVAHGDVVFFCEGLHSFLVGIQQFRDVEPARPIVCIFEDIEGLIEYDGNGALVRWLDGNLQVDKVVNIATTNYPERLERRIRSRPRRFDRVLRIESPDPRTRDLYFSRKVPDLRADERQRWVELSDGLSFAALAEMIISVRCLDKDLATTAALLKNLDQQQPSSQDDDDHGDDDDDDDHPLSADRRAARAANRSCFSQAIPF